MKPTRGRMEGWKEGELEMERQINAMHLWCSDATRDRIRSTLICIPRCLFPCWIIRCFQYFSNSHQQHLWVETSGTVKIVDSIQSYSKVKTPKRVAGNGPLFPPPSSPPRRNTCRRRRCRHRGLGRRRRRLVAPPTPHLTLAAAFPITTASAAAAATQLRLQKSSI